MGEDNNEKPLGRADRILLQAMKKRKEKNNLDKKPTSVNNITKNQDE